MSAGNQGGDDDRLTGPEMLAEHWEGFREYFWWAHVPSHRCVAVDGPIERQNCHAPCFGDEPANLEIEGYFVSCRYHDEHGNPISGDGFWVESLAVATREARKIRQAILDEKPAPVESTQMTLDDMLEGRR